MTLEVFIDKLKQRMFPDTLAKDTKLQFAREGYLYGFAEGEYEVNIAWIKRIRNKLYSLKQELEGLSDKCCTKSTILTKMFVLEELLESAPKMEELRGKL